MFRKSSIIFILVLSDSTNAKPQTTGSNNSALGDKPPRPIVQTFNINNWSGMKENLKLFTEMKHKIDSLSKKCGQRKYIAVCREDGWFRHGNARFLIIDIPTLKWSDARRTCQMLGGDLAIIRSAAEDNFIFQLLKKQKTVTNYGAWLGFVRKADSKLYWIDGTPLAQGYTAWGSGEPGKSEKCGNMFGLSKRAGKWNDITCDLSPGYLKEAPVILCQKKN